MASSDVSEILTVAEVAAQLRCSKAHVCNAINGKVKGVTLLPAISMGRRKLIRRATLAAWLLANDPASHDAMIVPSRRIDAVNA
jgi:excisionase family DNA binding protein